jgi:hypothetical protein
MLIEYQAKSIDKHSKQLEENVHTKVLIAQLESRKTREGIRYITR